jgi:hypothetical protein
MGIFSNILNKIFHRDRGAPPAQPAPPKPNVTPTQPSLTPAASPVAQPVDVEAVLTQMAASKGGGGNWRTSIVDLLKLLDLDSDLSARRELAEELGVHAGEHGSAEQNIALSKAVWKKLAENGGKVPDSLKD